MSTKRNGTVIRDISDNRIITFGLEADKIDNVERAGFVYKKGNYTFKALFPDVTEDKTIELGGGGGGGVKLYKHIISAFGEDVFEFISTRNYPFETDDDIKGDIDTIIVGFIIDDYSTYGSIPVIVGYNISPVDLSFLYCSNNSSSQIMEKVSPSVLTDTVIEL